MEQMFHCTPPQGIFSSTHFQNQIYIASHPSSRVISGITLSQCKFEQVTRLSHVSLGGQKSKTTMKDSFIPWEKCRAKPHFMYTYRGNYFVAVETDLYSMGYFKIIM